MYLNNGNIYPSWFTKEEDRKGLDEIRSFIRENNYPVGALIIEKGSFFIQAEVNELTDDLRNAAYRFNTSGHVLIFDFVEEYKITKGEAFHV